VYQQTATTIYILVHGVYSMEEQKVCRCGEKFISCTEECELCTMIDWQGIDNIEQKDNSSW